MKKYGRSYNNIGDSTNPIFKTTEQNRPAGEGEIDKHNRGYVNIGSTEKPVLQLVKCAGSNNAYCDLKIKSFILRFLCSLM